MSLVFVSKRIVGHYNYAMESDYYNMSHINGFPLGYYDGGHIDTTTWKCE
jgi:hypothetical protein